MITMFGFTGSGGGDQYQLESTFQVTQRQPNVIPEPATALLLSTGLVGFAAGVRRRRNS